MTGMMKRLAKWVRAALAGETEWYMAWEWDSDAERDAFRKLFRFAGWSRR